MNVTQFIKQMGTTKPTMYRKIKEAGIDLASLRQENGDLTDEGMQILAGLLDGTPQQKKILPASHVVSGNTEDVNAAERIKELETLYNTSQSALEAATARIRELETEILTLNRQALERAEKHADELREILKRQQDIESQRVLTARAGADGRGVWGKLRDLFQGMKPVKEDPAKDDQTKQ